jgi:hypothetical protein
MPNYVGDTFEITVSATDFDGSTVVTPTLLGNSGSVEVSIIDPNSDPVVTSQGMTWDSTRELWYYLWESTGQPSSGGQYQYKVQVIGEDGSQATAYGRLNLQTPTF